MPSAPGPSPHSRRGFGGAQAPRCGRDLRTAAPIVTTLLAESAATLAGTSETPELAGGAMPPRGRRVEILEPLRGLAALAVAWFHFTNATGLLPEGWLRASGRYGWLGVEVFFVISGFIIPYSLFNAGYRFPRHAGRFILKRIVRLDPPYIAAT